MSVLPFYKPIGWTPLQCINYLKKNFVEHKNSPITYAGRLDPMAEGLVLLLTDKTRYKKQNYLKLQKTYEATVVLGVTTDSLDALGIPKLNKGNGNKIDKKQIFNILLGSHRLPFPNYSSYKVQGKPLHWWAQQKRLNEIEIPLKEMTVLNLNKIRIQEISSSDLLIQVQKSTHEVSGNFRQEEILKAWKNILMKEQTFKTISFEATVSSGTYIRSLASLLGTELKTGGTLLHLKRTAVGDYTLSNAQSLPID